ncbi:methylenetetrahydrofolate reductase [Subtercola vilae]|uniref:Methylenetetrahydrofolate reductase n=1 Tax=Subtercola vilae TaxID=2056433 RepID=A0A4T2C1V7_9MICO|nr:methylenetetrahydrofolate reductase [Subtercola vilae]TIH36306.1 methylenetetrahydrofolate reductase [Subtercola vilae]
MTALRFEIIPADGVADRLARTFADTSAVTLTVTSLPQHGVERTVRASIELARLGFGVVPHLSARAIASRGELESILLRMHDSGIGEAFVVSGDGGSPAGSYSTSLELIHDIVDRAPQLSLGIAGYPEGHPHQSPDQLSKHLLERAPFVDKVVTQLCFSAETIGTYAAQLRASGVTAPLWVGVPGALRRSRLISLSARIGVGSSLGFLKRSAGVAGGLLRSRDFDPAPFIAELAAEPQLQRVGVAGLHVYSFNEIERLPEVQSLVARTHGAAAE